MFFIGKRKLEMVEKESENVEKIWIKFLSKHWKMFILFIIVAMLAFVGAVYVYLWLVGEAQLTGFVPTTLGLWTMGHFITFILHLIFWEIIYIGIPLILVIVAIIYLWWKKLPVDEREEYKSKNLFGKNSKSTQGGEGISFLVFIAFIIKIYLDGNWNLAFADWTFDYLVYSCLWALIWVLIIFGIPIAIGATLWIIYEMRKQI
jgi:hypothetical protein